MTPIRPGAKVRIRTTEYTVRQGAAGKSGRVVRTYDGEFPLTVRVGRDGSPEAKFYPLKYEEVETV